MRSGLELKKFTNPSGFLRRVGRILTDVYESASVMNSEDKAQPVVNEESSTSNVRACDIHQKLKMATTTTRTSLLLFKRTHVFKDKTSFFNPPDLQEASKNEYCFKHIK
ncbi:hypothetical protein EVAR_37885_1 [Eumeta japonica]|uniref:Uncharacterized protein n=1 Tax=Eumeta variegata TaxID=151549 RepID=A0A4C1Y9C6_EUMVA|nr:hypothetical protein EVAR_37885_1 [Eumeta japonica]